MKRKKTSLTGPSELIINRTDPEHVDHWLIYYTSSYRLTLGLALPTQATPNNTALGLTLTSLIRPCTLLPHPLFNTSGPLSD